MKTELKLLLVQINNNEWRDEKGCQTDEMCEWRQHYRWRPQGGNTQRCNYSHVHRSFWSCPWMSYNNIVMGAHITIKVQIPTHESPDERTEESCPGRATYPDLTKRWHPTGETRATWTTRFILLIEKSFMKIYNVYEWEFSEQLCTGP